MQKKKTVCTHEKLDKDSLHFGKFYPNQLIVPHPKQHRWQNKGRKTLQMRFWRLSFEFSGSSPGTKANADPAKSTVLAVKYTWSL